MSKEELSIEDIKEKMEEYEFYIESTDRAKTHKVIELIAEKELAYDKKSNKFRYTIHPRLYKLIEILAVLLIIALLVFLFIILKKTIFRILLVLFGLVAAVAGILCVIAIPETLEDRHYSKLRKISDELDKKYDPMIEQVLRSDERLATYVGGNWKKKEAFFSSAFYLKKLWKQEGRPL